MGKKRKVSSGTSLQSTTKEFNPKDARLNRITSYKDVADAQDEYFDDQDKIMFDSESDDDGPRMKRRRQADTVELSDEEVLGFDEDDEDEEGDEEAEKEPKAAQKKGKKTGRKGGDEDDEMEVDGKQDEGWWGTSRGEYYNADNLETEADALEEEQEAKRLQKKKLAKMAEEDFIFDEAEWGPTTQAGEGTQEAPVTEVLADYEIPADLTPEERYTLLQTQYPEFDHLVQEFNSVQPLVDVLRREAMGKAGTTVEAVKYWVLGCYVAALGSYFAILTSPARDASQPAGSKALKPAELRDHEVMDTLVRCRASWLKVRDLVSPARVEKSAQPVDTVKPNKIRPASMPEKAKTDVESAASKKKSAKDKIKAKKAKLAEAAVADMYHLEIKPSATRTAKKPTKPAGEDSDFGEDDVLDARSAAEKAARKKSLRFYTSQIVQKTSKRQDAGRDAGGDMDVPYRERLRDREVRREVDANTVPLGRSRRDGDGDDDDDDGGGISDAIDQDEEYYDMIASASRSKKDSKQARKEALAAASALDRVVEIEEVGDDGKRKITYAIEKNKGLTPRKSKDVRNPRVKYRKKMQQKQKKLVSMRGSNKSEGKYGYQGESTGINTRVIKSTKL